MNIVRWFKKLADKFKGKDNSRVREYPLYVPSNRVKHISERRRWTRRQYAKIKRKRRIERHSRKFNLMKARG